MPSREQRSGCGRIVLGCAGVVLVLLLGTCVAGGYAYRLWKGQPAGWTQAIATRDAQAIEQRRQSAVALENRLTRELSFTSEALDAYANGLEISGEAPALDGAAQQAFAGEKTVRIGTDELNAWLAERLRPWAANQGKPIPSGVNDFAYWVEDGLPVIAAHVQMEGVGQVVSAKLHPMIRSDGKASLRIDSVRGGELPIPMGRFQKQVEQGLTDNLKRDEVTQAMEVLRGQAFEPVLPVREGERVRVTKLAVTSEAIELTVRRERAGEDPGRR